MSSKFCIIIPDRGDRPEFLKHCLFQMDRQTLKPDKIYLIDYKPKTELFDLRERLISGIKKAKSDGFNDCFIIENDDYYPDNYLEKMQLTNYDIVGIEESIYYNLRFKTYNIRRHLLRASLYCTGFKISSIEDFLFPEKYIDIRLWDFARHLNFDLRVLSEKPIGMKHGIGLCGGVGHKDQSGNKDTGLIWLEDHTRLVSFEFYKKLICSIAESV